MADGPSIGYAALQVIPSMKGAVSGIEGEASSLGAKLGGLLSGGVGQALGPVKGHLTSAISLGVAGGVVAAGAGLFKLGETFDEEFDKIRASTGATGGELEVLKGQFKSVVSDVPTDFGSAGTAISEVTAKFGEVDAGSQKLSEQFLELSRITGTDLKGNLDAGTQALQNWNLNGNNGQVVMDELFRASQQSGVSFSTLASEVASGGVRFRAAGLDISQSIGFVAALGKAGIDASQVMPALSRAMATAAKEGKSTSDVFKDAFDTIQNGSEKVGNEKALQVFGARAGPQLAALIREGKLSWEGLAASIAGGKDTILKAGQDTQDFGEKWELLKNRAFVALEPIATKVFDTLTTGISYLADHQGVFQIVAGVVGGALVVAFAAWAVSAAAAAAATIAAALPVLAIIAGVGLLAVGIAELVTHFDLIRSAVSGVFDWVAAHWPLLLEILTGPIGLAVAFISANWSTITGIFQSVWSAVTGAVSAAWGAITGVISAGVGLIRGLIEVQLDAVQAVFSAVWGAVTAVVSTAWAVITGTISAGVGLLQAVISGGLAAVQSVFSAVWGAVTGVLRGAWDTMTGVVSSAVGGIVGFVTGMPGRIIGALSSLGGSLFNVASSAFSRFLTAESDGVATVVSFVGGVPGKIVKALGDVAHLLYDAGKKIMSGLLDGIKDGFGAVGHFASGVAGKIASLKGPLDYDAALLIPHGNAIMASLLQGLQERYGPVLDFVQQIASQISASVQGGLQGLAGLTSSAGGGTVAPISANRAAIAATDLAHRASQAAAQLQKVVHIDTLNLETNDRPQQFFNEALWQLAG